MRLTIFFISCLLAFSISLQAKITPTRLRCEYIHNPGVVDVVNPRLSWVNNAGKGERGQKQTAWEIRVASSKEKLHAGNADLWNSGKITSDESTNICYNGKLLTSRQDCWWQVRVYNKKGKASAWSQPAFWSMGLLKAEEWKAKWIGAPWQSANWSYMLATGAWWIWNDLPADVQEGVLKVVKFEAARFYNIEPPNNLKLDTKSEENAWNSQIFQAAMLLLPHDKDYLLWERLQKKWVISAYIRPADFKTNR
ncbi:MAG TPA: hypothetical protein VF298_03215 [Bacteroidales bacterium]